MGKQYEVRFLNSLPSHHDSTGITEILFYISRTTDEYPYQRNYSNMKSPAQIQQRIDHLKERENDVDVSFEIEKLK